LQSVPLGLLQGNDVNGLIAPGEVIPLLNDSVVVEQHYCKIGERKLQQETQVDCFKTLMYLFVVSTRSNNGLRSIKNT
jgi:hypothetical protein